MHNSFTPRHDPAECPQPEEHGGWQATVFRTMKALGACLGVTARGSLQLPSARSSAGTTRSCPSRLCQRTFPADPRPPEVYRLQGARFLGTPESEKSIAIKSIWVKLLADQSTRWVARTLYKQEQDPCPVCAVQRSTSPASTPA
ncbi:unnamed protein product [Effrenium voratum]|nr:unnamed protein product [Effrenium voratum]